MNIRKISDEKLYQICREYGNNAKLWRQRFIGLLPEVNRRRLYEKHNLCSIFEFAAKLAGLSHDQVARAINLEKKFEQAPTLKALLINGEVSINKLARVASIATADNEKALAEQVKLLPQKALETLVRDEKSLAQSSKQIPETLFKNNLHNNETCTGSQNVNDSQKPLFTCESVRAHNLELAEDVENELTELQQKGIDINQLLRDLLQKRKQEIAEEKEQIAAEQQINPTRPTRHICIKIKKLLHKEHGSKCSIPTCNKPAAIIHHSQRFALAATHDPHYLAPLCTGHHQIAHGIDRSFWRKIKYHS